MQDYLMTLLGGLAITLQLTAFSLLLGVLMAAAMTWVLERRIPVATQLVQLWVLIFTGTPLLIQIFLIYYGPGQFAWLKEGRSGRCSSSPGSAPYWRSASIPPLIPPGCSRGARCDSVGEVEACRALGFSAGQTLWMKVRHAARRLVPAYSNEVILVLKGSSLASTITIMDVMGLAQRLNAQTYDTLAVFTVAGALYLTMNGLLTIGFRWCERRALAFQG